MRNHFPSLKPNSGDRGGSGFPARKWMGSSFPSEGRQWSWRHRELESSGCFMSLDM